jgi:phage gp36-like protein
LTITALTDRVGSTFVSNVCAGYFGSALDSLLEDVISRAEGQIDVHLSSRYSTPVTASGFVDECALRAAEMELHGRKAGADVPERVRKNWEEALKTLERISDGKASLPGTSNASAMAAPMISSAESSYTNMTRFG